MVAEKRSGQSLAWLHRAAKKPPQGYVQKEAWSAVAISDLACGGPGLKGWDIGLGIWGFGRSKMPNWKESVLCRGYARMKVLSRAQGRRSFGTCNCSCRA